MTGLSSSLMSFAEDMEKEFRNLRILNNILVGTTAVLVLTTLIIVLVSAPP
jgi:predicted membrane channel-forming protein YqfA (hemolysin III family)